MSPFNPACVRDATTLAGLADLRRAHPDDWHRVMRRSAERVGLGATVGEALRLGGQGLLLPDYATDAAANQLKANRATARLAMRWFGQVRLEDVTEEWLRRERVRLAEWGEVSGQRTGRCITLLRRLALRAARHDRVQPRVRPRGPSGRMRRLGSRPDRPQAEWGDLELLLARATPRVRAALAIQAHVGASPGRVLALRVRDVEVTRGTVWVRLPGPDERLIREPFVLPPDAMRAVRPWLRKRARLGPDALLFPRRGDPSRPTKSISKAIRREAERLGVGAVTLQSVRRLAQVGLREMGGTRAQVRGSRRVRPRRSQAHPRRLERQRRGWGFQLGAGRGRLPQRAPRSCDADQPELQSRKPVRRVEVAPTPVVRQERPPVEVRPRTTGIDPSRDPLGWSWAMMDEAAVAGELPAIVQPAQPEPAPVQTQATAHTTVYVQGHSEAQVHGLVQQAFSSGVLTAEMLRRLHGGGS